MIAQKRKPAKHFLLMGLLEILTLVVAITTFTMDMPMWQKVSLFVVFTIAARILYFQQHVAMYMAVEMNAMLKMLENTIPNQRQKQYEKSNEEVPKVKFDPPFDAGSDNTLESLKALKRAMGSEMRLFVAKPDGEVLEYNPEREEGDGSSKNSGNENGSSSDLN